LHGEDHPEARLTAGKVREIRALWAETPPPGFRKPSTYSLAEQFGVSHVTIWKIVNGRAWRRA
jgi:DNA-binding FadR family transcriptional regulator